MDCRKTREWLLQGGEPRRRGGREAPRERFRRRLPPPVPRQATAGRWHFVRSRWALAAAVLLLARPIAWLSLLAPGTAETPDLVEQLVDWNIELAQASDAHQTE